MYGAARSILGSRRAAVIAAFLLAVNPLHIYYSQEVRMYGLVALLSSGILWSAWKILSANANRGILSGATGGSAVEGRRTALAYILLVTLALYTQYYAVFLPFGLTLYALWHWRRNLRALAGWVALQLVAALLYLPWVIYAAPHLTLYISQKVVHDADKPLGPLAYLARHLSAFTVGHLEGPLAPWWPLALVLLLPVVVGLVVALRAPRSGEGRHSQRRPSPGDEAHSQDAPPHPIAFLLTVLATALFLGWLIGLRYPFFPDRGERLLLLALPPFIMLVAAGIDALLRAMRPLAYATAALILLTSAVSLAAFYTVPRYPEDDYRPLIARTVEQGLPEDTVFAVYPWQVGYWRSYAAGVDGPAAVLTPSVTWGPEIESALDTAIGRGHVWFPAHLSLGGILETQVESYLGQRAKPFANTWYGAGTRLSGWSSREEIAQPADAPFSAEAQYDGAAGPFLVRGAAPSTAPIPAANAVFPLRLNWSRQGPAPLDAAVSVRLVDDLGQIWAQNDYEPAGGMVGPAGTGAGDGHLTTTDNLGLLIPAGTPPGRYTVELVVSTPGGSTLPARVNGKTLQSLPLFPLEVTPAGRTLGSERLPIATRQQTGLDDGIRFLGYTVDDAPLAPGDTRRVNLFWQATGQPSAAYAAFVQALGPDGAPVAGWEAPPGAAYPTSQWTPGTLIRTQAALRFPAETPDGRYPLIAGLYNPADGRRLKTERGADQLSLGAVAVKGRPHDMNAPSPAVPAGVTFGDVARLVGYDAGPIDATGALTVTLHWQALSASERPLTVFVHLLDEQSNTVGYGDSEPGSGAYPTTGWLKGEYLADTHTVTFPPGALKSPVRLAIGLYDPSTGERLLSAGGEDQTVVDLPN
jgi:hypothetical protein